MEKKRLKTMKAQRNKCSNEIVLIDQWHRRGELEMSRPSPVTRRGECTLSHKHPPFDTAL